MMIVIGNGMEGANPNKIVNVYGKPGEENKIVSEVMDKISSKKI